MFWVIFIVFFVIGLLVQGRLKSKFAKYSRTPLHSGLSGKEVAERMLQENRIFDVTVISVGGKLTDHYNPEKKTVNLSRDVYSGRNIAAASVAAHECGHAVQHAQAYGFLKLRSALVPYVNASSQILNVVFIGSFLLGGLFHVFSMSTALLIIIICQAFITLFSLITLPVEFDASNRALAWMHKSGVVGSGELKNGKDALNWAAMTYVVAALSSLTFLLYYLSAFMGGDD